MNKEVKEICLKCEHNIHCQNKGCAFRSLGNEYCNEVENANNLINNLQQEKILLQLELNQLETNIDELEKCLEENRNCYIYQDGLGEDWYFGDLDVFDELLSTLKRGKE